MAPELDGGEAILAALRMAGVEHIFSSPGSEWAPVWEALARQRRDHVEGPRYHDLTHETLAVGMATGYALVARKLAAVLLHAGPGLLQGANAIHGALLAGAPMVVASSESVTYGEGPGPDPGSQWYRNLSVVGGPHTFAAPWTKWSNQTGSVDVLYEMMLRAFEIAQRPPAGPVYLNVPLETLLAQWTPPSRPKALAAPGRRVSPVAEIESLAELLAAARQPVVITESAGRDPAAFHALVELCELVGIPVIEPQSTVCANFPKSHPMHIGADVAQAADADLVLLVSCRAPWYPPSSSPSPEALIVVIDDVPQRPQAVYQVLQADRYLEGEVAATLQALTEAVAPRLRAGDVETRRERWESVHGEQAEVRRAQERDAAQVTDRITAVALVTALREELDDDALYIDETITHSRVIQSHLQFDRPDSWIYVQGGLGQGTGWALGAKLAAPQRLVVLTIGDGSFLYNPVPQALMAAQALALPLLIVVFNNRQYLSMKFNHLRFYPDGAAVAGDDFDGVDLSGQPPLSELGSPFGLPGWEVSDPRQLRPALREATASVTAGRTAIVNVALAR